MANQLAMRLRIREVAKDLENQRELECIKDAYSVEWSVSPRTIERYIAAAKEMIDKKLDEDDEAMKAIRTQLVQEDAESRIRSNLELESLLTLIIEGQVETRKSIHKMPACTVVTSGPKPWEMIKAIELLMKKRGLFKHEEAKPNQTLVVVNQQQQVNGEVATQT